MLVLPCSKSCWSYHGSSSSVTNSSIVSELSIGLPLLKAQKQALPWVQKSSRVNSREDQRQASLRTAPPADNASQWAAGHGVVCVSTCFLLAGLPPWSSVTPTTSPSHPSEPASDVAATLQSHFLLSPLLCRFSSSSSSTLQRCLQVLLVTFDTNAV